MNWGKGITLVLIIFIGFILSLTITMMSKQSDLEDEDYYAREVNYEQEIQAQKNAISFGEIIVNNEVDNIVLDFPKDIQTSSIKVFFIRPNDKKLDKEFVFDNSDNLYVPKDKLMNGKYKMEISYEVGEKKCLQKGEIII